MNINTPAENKKIQNPKLESKSKTKFEKIREILNNPVTKFCGGLLGSSTLFGATGFLIYLYNKNKSKEKIDHKEYKERMVNGIKISVAVREWISKNIFLCAWKNGSCWNDTFTQLLMSPEIRCKECKSSKINKLFNWINDNLNEPYNGDCLERKIKIKDTIRVFPDNFKKGTYNPVHALDLLLENFKFDNINFNDLNILNLIDDSYTGDKFEENLKKSINNKENFYIELNKKDKEAVHNLYSDYDYYPTFVVTNNKNNSHVYGYYIIYDKYKNIKYFLCVDGIKDSIEVLTKDEGLEKLKNCGRTSVKYSHWDTVERYYSVCS